MTAMAPVQAERIEDWMELVLNRPDQLNLLDDEMAQACLDALAESEFDDGVRGILVRARGKAFCAGVDTTGFTVAPGGYFKAFRQRKRRKALNRLFRELSQVSKPVVAVVEGYALGGGFELALACDMIVASDNAQFGLPECKLGLMPGGGGTYYVARQAGVAFAKELIWTGRRIGAQEACERRLVNHVVPAGEALEKARAILREIAGNAPLPIMLSKPVLQKIASLSPQDALDLESDTSFMPYFSTDRDEGIAAFKQKRRADFKGE